MIAVLLLAFGCPDSIESIEPYITNVMGGRKPSPEQLQKIKERYQKIGGRSPLLDITKRQSEALERDLNRGKGQGVRDKEFRVFVGMRYWHPFIKDALKEIVSLNAERIVVLVMAPHYSKISTGHYIKTVNDAMAELTSISPIYIRGSGGGLNISFVNNWHTHPLFLESVAEKIKNGISNFPSLISSPLRGEGEGVQIIFSAHSLPQKDDTYVKQLHETIDGVIKLTGDISWHLGFQSKGMSPGEWLEPTVDSILERLSKEGKKYVLMAPVGFVSDNIETLYDIDIVYKKKAESLGLIFHRTESLNDSPKFIESLSSIIREQL
jgi:ferrochelatase